MLPAEQDPHVEGKAQVTGSLVGGIPSAPSASTALGVPPVPGIPPAPGASSALTAPSTVIAPPALVAPSAVFAPPVLVAPSTPGVPPVPIVPPVLVAPSGLSGPRRLLLLLQAAKPTLANIARTTGNPFLSQIGVPIGCTFYHDRTEMSKLITATPTAACRLVSPAP